MHLTGSRREVRRLIQDMPGQTNLRWFLSSILEVICQTDLLTTVHPRINVLWIKRAIFFVACWGVFAGTILRKRYAGPLSPGFRSHIESHLVSAFLFSSSCCRFCFKNFTALLLPEHTVLLIMANANLVFVIDGCGLKANSGRLSDSFRKVHKADQWPWE